MANLMNYQESNAAMLMLETQQRAIGTKTTAATANGDTSAGEPPSPLIKIGGARFHQHLPPPYHHALLPKEQHQQQHHYQAQQHFLEENVQETPVRKASSSCVNVVHENAAASHALAASTTATTLAAAASGSSDGVDDIRKCGYLRKQKHGHKRFFVLRGPSHLGPSRLEYYDSEKKFRNSLRAAATAAAAASPPKRVIYLYQCFTVNKRADSKNKYLIALYTKDEYFAIVAENEQEQEDWYLAVSDLMNEGKRSHLDADEVDDGYGTVTPGTVFKEVWQVNVKPKGLGQTKNLTGVYRLCLSTKTIHLVKLNSETPCVNLQLMNIRRCGHSESFFFIEVGRSSSIGPGEIWMQVDDSVVAQNMHETILETMKALKAFAEFRPRSKSQSSGSNPMPFITTRRHLGNLPPSQTGLQRRSRTESVAGTPPASKGGVASGYRFRTSSEGEGTMNRPFRSVTGSLVHLSAARVNLGRQEGAGGRYVRALPGSAYHTRSASLPVSHFPSTTSPVSVSSSSGHGSASDTLTRPSSASICGSPSDGGFNSSDEYGSSPGDFRYFRVRSNTPDSLGNTPPIREEHCLSDYMAMGRHREAAGAADASHDDGADDEKALRKRTHSFSRPTGGSNGVAMYQKMTQTTSSLDESVAEAGPLGSNGHLACQAEPPSLYAEHRRDASEDDGYMPMMPGVVPSRDGDYTPMQPSAHLSASRHEQMAAPLSPPQVDAQGYMMMLPGGGSSPLQAAPRPGADHRENGEYMDMSQSGGGAVPRKHPNEGYYPPATPEPPKSYSPYFSLPRSYKAPHRENRERDEYVPMSSPVKPGYAAAECAGGGQASNPPAPQGSADGCGDRQVARPTRLSLGRHSFHSSPAVSEAAEPPSSPGEYINIEFGDRAAYTPCSLSAEGSPSSLGSSSEHRRSPLHEDYMSLDTDKGHLPKGHSPRPSLVAPWNPPSYIRPLASGAALGGRTDGYTEMTFSRGAEAKSPTAMLQHLCVMEQHYPSQAPPSPPVEPRVIRADPQGRRRHSSETFSSSSPPGNSGGGSPAPTSPHPVDGAKWQSSASFDSAWLHVEGAAAPADATAAALPVPTDVGCGPAGRACRNVPAGYQNGLNYIALDLREDPRASLYAPPAVTPSPPSPLPLPENGAYASIDFAKSEGLTAASQD